MQSAFSLFLLPDVSEDGGSSEHAFAHGLCVLPPPSLCLAAAASILLTLSPPFIRYGFNGNLVGMGLGAPALRMSIYEHFISIARPLAQYHPPPLATPFRNVPGS